MPKKLNAKFLRLKSASEMIFTQVVSDIHLEFYENDSMPNFESIVIPTSPILLLAGDIGYPENTITHKFIEWCSKNWVHVIMIAGNHEYYNSSRYHTWNTNGCYTMAYKESMLYSLASKFKNVHFLQKDTFDIPGSNVRILGCTLWSDYDLYNIPQIEKYMADFKYISLGNNEHITPYELLTVHRDHVAWLKNELDNATRDNKKVIVLTHHLPLMELIDVQYEGNPVNSAFATDMSSLMNKYPCIVNWFAGHSHSAKELVHTRDDKSTVLITINCRGYPDESVDSFTRSKVVIIDSDRVYEDVVM